MKIPFFTYQKISGWMAAVLVAFNLPFFLGGCAVADTALPQAELAPAILNGQVLSTGIRTAQALITSADAPNTATQVWMRGNQFVITGPWAGGCWQWVGVDMNNIYAGPRAFWQAIGGKGNLVDAKTMSGFADTLRSQGFQKVATPGIIAETWKVLMNLASARIFWVSILVMPVMPDLMPDDVYPIDG